MGFNLGFKGLNGHPLLCMFLAIDFNGYLVVSASYCTLTGLIFGA